VIRVSAPEDFRVDEIPLYPPRGEGGHTFLRVEKSGLATEQVARALARAAGVPPRDVGYAGRKDRFAVTTQWFSVPGLAPEAALGLALDGARVLEAAAHPHKLRTGHLRGNRFRITVRDVSAAAAGEAQRRLEHCVEEGMPNRFGGQRFGRDGANAERGRALLTGRARVRERREARFLLSALQAEAFNAVLAAREPELGRLERGDLAVVHASGGLFLVEDPEREAPRAAAFEISPTGPIFGARMRRPEGRPGERERAVLEALRIPESPRPPRGIPLRGSRRPLRVRPEAARAEAREGLLRLEFSLPPGSYATVLLDALLPSREADDSVESRGLC
jgi:tRNA pseudouridine13 synthase